MRPPRQSPNQRDNARPYTQSVEEVPIRVFSACPARAPDRADGWSRAKAPKVSDSNGKRLEWIPNADKTRKNFSTWDNPKTSDSSLSLSLDQFLSVSSSPRCFKNEPFGEFARIPSPISSVFKSFAIWEIAIAALRKFSHLAE